MSTGAGWEVAALLATKAYDYPTPQGLLRDAVERYLQDGIARMTGTAPPIRNSDDLEAEPAHYSEAEVASWWSEVDAHWDAVDVLRWEDVVLRDVRVAYPAPERGTYRVTVGYGGVGFLASLAWDITSPPAPLVDANGPTYAQILLLDAQPEDGGLYLYCPEGCRFVTRLSSRSS